MPHEVEFVPVFYNKGAFAKAGICEAPKTWDAFVGLNRTLKSAGVLPMNIARGRTNPGHNFSIFLMGLTGKEGFDDLLYRDKRWDQSEPVVQAAQTLVDLQRQGYIPQDCQTGDYNLGNDFQNATQAMGNGTWQVADFERASGRPSASSTTSSSPRPRTPRSSPPSRGASGAASPSGRRPGTARARPPSSTS